jgi:hypothetical protein
MMAMSPPANTASKAAEPAVPVADQEPELLSPVAEIHEQIAGLLSHPSAGGLGSDPGQAHAAPGVLDHHQDV